MQKIKLKNYRKANNLTQKMFAKKAKLSLITIKRFESERDIGQFKIDTIRKIFKACN